VHSDGEIWIATQFDIRDLFLDRYPSNGLPDRPAAAASGP
jgi:hypothetical protein